MFEFIIFLVVVLIIWNLRRAGRIVLKDGKKLAEMKSIEWHNSLDLIDDATLEQQINEILNPTKPKKAK